MSLLLFLALFSSAFASDFYARLLNLENRPHQEITEIVRWRQPVCVKAGEGVQPCALSISGHRSHYEMKRAKSQAAIESEDEVKARKTTLSSSELKDKISLEEIEPSSIEEPTQELREKTPSLDESLSQGTIRVKRDISEPESRILNKPEMKIVVTRVINSQMTATLVAENCLPDIALPACDDADEDKTKGEQLIAVVYEKVQGIGQKLADTKAELAANIEHKKQMLVQGMESMKQDIYDKTASIVHQVLDAKLGFYNKTASIVRGIEDKRQQLVENLSHQKDAIVEAIFNATGQKKKLIQGAIEKKQTAVKNLVSGSQQVVQNIIDAKTKMELELADRKQEFIDKVVNKKLALINNLTEGTTGFVKHLAEKKAEAIKHAADRAQELIGTVSVGKPLVVGQIQDALGLKPHKELNFGEVEEVPVEGEPIEQEPVEQEPIEQEPVEVEPIEQEPVEQEPIEQEPEQEVSSDLNENTNAEEGPTNESQPQEIGEGEPTDSRFPPVSQNTVELPSNATSSESEPISSDEDKPIEVVYDPVTDQQQLILDIDARSKFGKNTKPIEAEENLTPVVASNEEGSGHRGW